MFAVQLKRRGQSYRYRNVYETRKAALVACRMTAGILGWSRRCFSVVKVSV